MIANIRTRVDFGGITNYANDHKNAKKQGKLLAHCGVCAISNKTIADSFYIQSSLRPSVEKPVKHISLSFSPNDAARFPDNAKGDALMVEIAQKWMERMGVKNTQYIIARHHDTKHPHCHVVYNAVDNEGQHISDSNERRRSVKICRALTEEYGLYIAPKHSKARNKDRLRAHQLQRYNLRMATLDALALAHSWNEFKAILQRSGIDLRFNQTKEGGAIRGISFGMDDVHIAGSRLDADLSFPKLCSTLGTIVEEVALQPHQAFTPCGGGSSNNNRGWRDDDEKKPQRKPEPFYKPSKSRR